jgi:hypothetical protein
LIEQAGLGKLVKQLQVALMMSIISNGCISLCSMCVSASVPILKTKAPLEYESSGAFR